MSLSTAAMSTPDDTAASRTVQVQALMDKLRAKSPIYGLILSDMTLVQVIRGSVTLHLKLGATHLNSKGGLHGAVSATIVDFVTGLAICSHDLRETTGASVDMHLTFLSEARADDIIVVHASADKVGGNLAFVSVDLNKLDAAAAGGEKPVTLARHTKFVRGTAPSPKAGVS